MSGKISVPVREGGVVVDSEAITAEDMRRMERGGGEHNTLYCERKTRVRWIVLFVGCVTTRLELGLCVLFMMGLLPLVIVGFQH
jgi:hypothetical protein